MNRILSRFVFLAFFAVNSLPAATPTVTVTLSDFTADHSGADYVVRLTPVTGGTARRELTDSDGIASFTSVTPAIYSLSIEGAGVPTLQIRVPNTASTTAASTIVISAWTPPGTSTITSGIWENDSGTIKPSAGQARSTLQFISGAADSASSVAFDVDTALAWTDGDAGARGYLAKFSNAGALKSYISPEGAYYRGADASVGLFSGAGHDSLVSVTSTEAGETDTWNLTVGAVSDVSSVAGAWFRAVGTTNEVNLNAFVGDPDDNNGLEFAGTQTNGLLTLSYQGDVLTKIHPTIATTGSAIAYDFSTSNQLTNSDRIVSFKNLGIEQAAIFPTGAIAAGTTNRWKTGAVVTGATVALTLTNYVSITINGVVYKLGLVQ